MTFLFVIKEEKGGDIPFGIEAVRVIPVNKKKMSSTDLQRRMKKRQEQIG